MKLLSLRRLFGLGLGLATLIAPLAAPAMAASVNTVIKGSGPTLYWYASNGKRYVFPNSNTYYSWYAYSNYTLVSDNELSAITLGGNVTYRPGAKLIKVTTDPKVYAVARNGMLRWVTSEYIASQLYGADWNQKVHDVPDVFFTNYLVGTPIWNAWEYNVSNEYNGVFNPSDSLRDSTYTNNSGGLSGTVQLTASNTNVRPNESVTLTTTVNSLSTSVASTVIRIYDEQSNSLLRTCTGTWSCSVTINASASAGTNQRYYADVSDGLGRSLSRIYSPYIYVQYSTYFTGSLTLNVDRTSLRTGEQAVFTANVYNYTTAVQNVTIRIYDERDGSLLRTCTGASSCSQTYTAFGQNTQSFRYYAEATDGYTNLTRAYSPTVSVSPTGSSSGSLSGMTDIYVAPAPRINSTVYVTASITNPSASVQDLTIRIYDSRYSDHIGLCSGAFSCSIPFSIGPSNISTSVYATFTDRNGNSVRTGNVSVSTY